MLVALGFTGGEGGDVEGGLDGGEGCVGGVLRKIAGKALNGALYVGDHHVLDFEFGDGVGRIDFPCDERGGGGGIPLEAPFTYLGPGEIFAAPTILAPT